VILPETIAAAKGGCHVFALDARKSADFKLVTRNTGTRPRTAE